MLNILKENALGWFLLVLLDEIYFFVFILLYFYKIIKKKIF